MEMNVTHVSFPTTATRSTCPLLRAFALIRIRPALLTCQQKVRGGKNESLDDVSLSHDHSLKSVGENCYDGRVTFERPAGGWSK